MLSAVFVLSWPVAAGKASGEATAAPAAAIATAGIALPMRGANAVVNAPRRCASAAEKVSGGLKMVKTLSVAMAPQRQDAER